MVGRAAGLLGDGGLDLTSRGNVQLRGLDESCGTELARMLHEAGLLPSEAHERVRNIVASPSAGLDGLGSADVQLWARQLDGLVCASPVATGLSGRFLFALDDGRGDMAGLGADVTLLAGSDGSAILRTGTDRSGLRLPAIEAPRAALLAAETFLTLVADSGSGAWRVTELPAGHGLDAAVAEALSGAGIPVTAAPVPATPVPAPPAPGRFVSPGATVAVSVYPRLGHLDLAQWRLLTEAAHDSACRNSAHPHSAAGSIRITPWRGVIVPGLEPAAADALLTRLDAAGLITGPGSPWHRVGACTGRPGCARALSDVRADAVTAVTTSVSRDGAGELPVYLSGCARRCGHPPGGDWVDVVSTGEGGYQISVPGRPTAPRAATAGPELADAVAAARTLTVTG
jgi:precorrin-3B synthase